MIYYIMVSLCIITYNNILGRISWSNILYFQSLSYEKMYTYRYLSKQIIKLDIPPKKSYYPLQGLIKVVPVVSVNSRTHLVLIFFWYKVCKVQYACSRTWTSGFGNKHMSEKAFSGKRLQAHKCAVDGRQSAIHANKLSYTAHLCRMSAIGCGNLQFS